MSTRGSVFRATTGADTSARQYGRNLSGKTCRPMSQSSSFPNGAAEGNLIRELLCRSAPAVAIVESVHARE